MSRDVDGDSSTREYMDEEGELKMRKRRNGTMQRYEYMVFQTKA